MLIPNRYLVLLLGCLSSIGSASLLSSGLKQTEIDDIVQKFAFGSAAKALRSAEAYDVFPGVRIGVEICLVTASGVEQMGDANGSMPSVVPIPRLHLTKGLVGGGELSFSIFPATVESTIGTYGGTLKWTMLDEHEDWVAIAGYFGYTYATAFRKTFASNTFELGAVASKDLVRLKPYLGLSLMTAAGRVATSLTAGGYPDSNRRFAIHSFIGTELELPVNLAFQIDLFNLSPAASLSVGAKF